MPRPSSAATSLRSAWCAGALVLSVDAHTWLPLPATLNLSESREAAAREGSMGCSPCEPCPRAFRVTHGMACVTRWLLARSRPITERTPRRGSYGAGPDRARGPSASHRGGLPHRRHSTVQCRHPGRLRAWESLNTQACSRIPYIVRPFRVTQRFWYGSEGLHQAVAPAIGV